MTSIKALPVLFLGLFLTFPVCAKDAPTVAGPASGKGESENADNPAPFGFVFGKTTREDVLNILKKEGASVVQGGYRIIKGKITNPHVEGYVLKDIGIDGVVTAKVWFLDGVLMELTYTLSGSFQPFYDQLKVKYQEPSKATTDFGGEAHARWLFKDIGLSLDKPFMGDMTMDYTHVQMYNESNSLDDKVYAESTKAMGQQQKGF
jgi:hypothetical protein